jgi:hypothetical protein
MRQRDAAVGSGDLRSIAPSLHRSSGQSSRSPQVFVGDLAS